MLRTRTVLKKKNKITNSFWLHKFLNVYLYPAAQNPAECRCQQIFFLIDYNIIAVKVVINGIHLRCWIHRRNVHHRC